MVSRHLLATPPQPTSEDLLWLTPNSAFIPRVAICHGGTYITSDNFSAQKNNFQNSVTIFTDSTPVWGNTESTGVNIKLDSDLTVLSDIDSMNQ